jgi:hypothetical protein
LALLSAKGKEENIHPVLLKAARARLDSWAIPGMREKTNVEKRL